MPDLTDTDLKDTLKTLDPVEMAKRGGIIPRLYKMFEPEMIALKTVIGVEMERRREQKEK